MKKLNLIITIILVAASLFGQDVGIQGNATITGKLQLMDTLQFADGSTQSTSSLGFLKDEDGDTKITTEDKPDEDRIRFQVGGNEAMRLDQTNLRLAFGGNSIYIGNSTGLNDDGTNNGNVAIGLSAAGGMVSGSYNTVLGNYAAGGLNSGSENVIIGSEAGSEEDGNQNVFLGNKAGFGNGGTGNVFLGYSAGSSISGSNKLVIENSNATTPLLYGDFQANKVAINGTSNLGSANFTVHDIDGSWGGMYINTTSEGLPFYGYAQGGIVRAYEYVDSENNWRMYKSGNALTLDNSNNLGIGTSNPDNRLHVYDFNSTGHVMKIENSSNSPSASGLEIKINRTTTGPGNNYVTFNDSDGIAGRIEGFNLTESNLLATFPEIDFSAYFSPISIENLAFDHGQLPTLNSGSLPYLSGGSWPSLSGGSLPYLYGGSLPSLSGGSFGSISFNVDFDDLANNLSCQANPFCNNYVPWISGGITGASFPTLNSGSLPSLNPGSFPTLNSGSWPSLNGGSLPTLSGGELPSFNFDVILDPTPIFAAQANFKEVICWALENGERSLVTTNPWDLSMLANGAVLNSIAECKNGGVTYGSGGADYAEYLPRKDYNEEIVEGQIVGVKGGRISKNTEDADQLLVISMMPIVLGNLPEDTLTIDQYEKVAFLGQAPVWVVGKVRSGDYIIPSGQSDGYGLAVAPEEISLEHVSKIVGRAWADGNETINLVNMAIGLKTNELAGIVQKIEDNIEDLDSRIAAIESQLSLASK